MDDFLADLEAEIASDLDKRRKAVEAEALRRKSLNQRLPLQTRLAARTAFRQTAAEIEALNWETIGVAAIFTEQTCRRCGSIHRIFLQFMLRERRWVVKPFTERYIRLAPNATLPEELPRSVIIQPHITQICESCCAAEGFAILTATRLREVIIPSVPHSDDKESTYVQTA